MDRVFARLWQGAAPNLLERYQEFQTIVLCAKEVQPMLGRFQGRVLRAPFDDTLSPTPREIATAMDAARKVAERLCAGERVLVTCHMGLNRSGLVAGLALRLGTWMSPEEILYYMRKARGPNALSNPAFVHILRAC